MFTFYLALTTRWLAVKAFPSIVFDVGEGHDRYELIKKWRWWLLTGVIFSSSGGGLLVKLLYTWLFESRANQPFSS